MSTRPLRIALLGGVPELLGGGGLEHQLLRTGEALRALGHDARPAHAWRAGDEIDVVHAFNHGGDIVHYVEHWRRAPAAFVFSPVLVVQPSHEWRTRVGRHLPIPAFPARAIRTLVGKADLTIGLTAWEADLMAQLGGVDRARCVVIGNGVDPVEPATELPALPEDFVVSVGSVSGRKRQAAVAEALAGVGVPYVVIGGAEGDTDPDAFRRTVAATGGAWLGELHDPATIRGIVGRARAHAQLSEREGQSLAVLEALASSTPVLASDLPSHRELRDAHPGWVTVVDGPEALARAAASLTAPSGAAPQIPTWREIAAHVVEAYRTAMTRPARTGQDR